MYGINSTVPIPSSINSSAGNNSSVNNGGAGTGAGAGTALHVVAVSGQLTPGATFMSDYNRASPRNAAGMAQQVIPPNAVSGTEGSFVGLQGPLPAQQQVQQLQLQQLQQQHMQHLHLQQLQQQQAQLQMSPQLAMASQQQRLQQMSPHIQQPQQPQQPQQQQLLHQQAHALGRTQMSPSLQSNQQIQQHQQHRTQIQQHMQMQQQALSNQSPQLSQSQAQLVPSPQQQIQLPTQTVPSTPGLSNASQPVPIFGQQEGPLTPLQMQFLQQRQIQMQQQQFQQQQQQQQMRQHLQQQHLQHQLQMNSRSPQMVQTAQHVQPLASMNPQTPQTHQQLQQDGQQLGGMPVQSSQDLSLAEEWNARALLRLTEFGRELGVNTANTTIQFWQSFVAKFYGSAGRMRYKLVNPATNDSKVFELVAAALPRLYLKNVEAGVKGMQVMLEQTLGQTGTLPLTVECPNVSMVSHYLNGSRVFAKGAIKATFASDFKFDLLELTSLEFAVFIPRPVDDPSLSPVLDVKTEGKKKGGSKKATPAQKKPTPSIPEIVVNEFGIASKTMQQLELLRERQALMRNRQMSAQYQSSAAGIFATPMYLHTSGQATGQVMMMSSAAALQAQSQARASASPRSMKRRTSMGISPSESSQVASPVASPALDESLASHAQGGRGAVRVGTPTLQHPMLASHSNNADQSQGAANLGSPSVMSPVFAPSNAVTAPSTSAPVLTVKGSKRVRTASVTPTLAAATAATSALTSTNGAKVVSASGPLNGSALSTGRNRKGAGRKDSNTKRKPSVSEDHLGLENATPDSAAGPPESIPSGTAIGGGPRGGAGTSPMLVAGGISGPRTPGTPGPGTMPHGPLTHPVTLPVQGVAPRTPFTSNNNINNMNGNGVHDTVNGASHPLQNIPGKGMEGELVFPSGAQQPQGPVLAAHKGVYATAVDPGGLPNGFVHLAGQAQPHGGQHIYGSGPGIGLGLGLGMQPQLQQYQQQQPQQQQQLQQHQLLQQQQQQQHAGLGQAGVAAVSSMDGMTVAPQNMSFAKATDR
ncbi:hypothetical protein EC968_000808 [Mortierella alpina]|nr:hypothetical protein EC968_000808 [Mortierella alpina]